MNIDMIYDSKLIQHLDILLQGQIYISSFPDAKLFVCMQRDCSEQRGKNGPNTHENNKDRQ